MLSSGSVADKIMPIGRYVAWVGTALLVLLLTANWFLPQTMAEPTGDEVNKPVIRIASMQQAPERIVIDTSLPTIAPPPPPAVDATPEEQPERAQSCASITPSTVAGFENRKSKVKKNGGERGCNKPATHTSSPIGE